jgi:hypothetical protein
MTWRTRTAVRPVRWAPGHGRRHARAPDIASHHRPRLFLAARALLHGAPPAAITSPGSGRLRRSGADARNDDLGASATWTRRLSLRPPMRKRARASRGARTLSKRGVPRPGAETLGRGGEASGWRLQRVRTPGARGGAPHCQRGHGCVQNTSRSTRMQRVLAHENGDLEKRADTAQVSEVALVRRAAQPPDMGLEVERWAVHVPNADGIASDPEGVDRPKRLPRRSACATRSRSRRPASLRAPRTPR